MSQENIIRFSILVLLVAVFTMSGRFRRRADQADRKVSPEQEDQLLLKIRSMGAMLMYGGVLLYLINPGWMRWSQVTALPGWVRWVGVGLVALVVPLFYWQLSSLGKNITKTVAIRSEHTLVTSGPYKYIRHPLYAFGFMFIVGTAVALANWFILGMAVLTWIPLAMRTPLEEQKLIEAFGDEYRAYMQRTGRYFPKMF